jgi:hypothetical protein
MKISSLALAAAVLALAGCAKAASPPSCESVTPPPAPILVSPAPGSTGVSVTIGSLTIQNFSNPDTAFLQPGSPGSIIPLGTPATGSSIAVPALAAHTTYSVVVSTPSFNPCDIGESAAHLPQTFQLGSFTTQ